ncbi:hypothetical protein OPQ81_003322 [Rhizoctonia solani]|nr:hypothetical protein OPQ81_003322 [Rhizoctonia solani]
MRTAEHFTSADPFRVNYTDADPGSIFPSQGENGPVAASYNSWYGDMTLPFWKSMANLGVPTNFDPDSGNAFGTFNTPSTVNRTTGRRSYAATTYYAYNAHRPNFVVLTGAQATKINFQNTTSGSKNKNLVASGVSFVHKSQTHTVKVKKEVILSAGAFQSPPSTRAQRDRQFHNPSEDHLILTTLYELKPGSSTQGFDDLRNNATFAAAAAAQYNATHDGILSYPVGSILSFINLDFMASSAEISRMRARLDREIASENITPLQEISYDIQKGWLKKRVGLIEVGMYPGYVGAVAPKANTSYISISLFLEHPFSRGNIHVNTSDPLIAPVIDPKYFSKSIASVIASRQEPPPEVTSNLAIADYVKAHVSSSHHPIGTVAMAPKELGGVVNGHLKVYGTANIRVVDASVIPLHIGAHIQRTVYGIAEKAATMIKRGL